MAACSRKLRAIVTLALITGARIGELLALRWEDCQDGFLTFWETKNGKMRFRQVFDRAVVRAGITSGDVTLHTLRHTALNRMIAGGYDDYTVMAISGHSSTRMLARYTHPTDERKIGALDLPAVVTTRSQNDATDDDVSSSASEIAKLLKEVGGRQGDRTPDLCIANAALSQLS